MKHLQHIETYPYNNDYTDTICWYKLVYIRATGVPAIPTASLESLNNLTFLSLASFAFPTVGGTKLLESNPEPFSCEVVVLNVYHWNAQQKSNK